MFPGGWPISLIWLSESPGTPHHKAEIGNHLITAEGVYHLQSKPTSDPDLYSWFYLSIHKQKLTLKVFWILQFHGQVANVAQIHESFNVRSAVGIEIQELENQDLRFGCKNILTTSAEPLTLLLGIYNFESSSHAAIHL